MYKSLCGHIFSFLLGIYLGMLISWLSGNSNLFRSCQTYFPGLINLHSHWQCTKVLLSLHLHQHLLSIFFFWTFLVGIIQVSCDYDLHFLMMLSIFSCACLQRNVFICIPSGKCLFRCFAHFLKIEI